MSLLFCYCDLGCREPLERRQEACLLTQLSVYADFTFHPPAVLAALLSNPPLLPFPHPSLLLLDKSLSPTTMSTYHLSSCFLFQLQQCILLPVHLFPPPSHPSSINSLSLPSLSNPRLIALFRGSFWQPSVELIHELVLGHCNQPLFVAHYQLPGAELFTKAQ